MSRVTNLRFFACALTLLLFFSLILLGSTGSFTIASAKASPKFAPALNLSNDSGIAKDATISNNGQNVYVAWTEGNSGIFFRESNNSGVSWIPPLSSPALKLSPPGGVSQFPVMFTQYQSVNSGDVYVTWSQTVKQTNGSMVLQVFVAASNNNGITFKTIQLSTNSTHAQITPAIGASSSNVYVSWFSQKVSYEIPGAIYVSSSANNGQRWSAPRDIYRYSTNGEPEIVASGSNVYAMMDQSNFVYSHNNGTTWSNYTALYNYTKVNGSINYAREPWIAGYGNLVYTTWEANSTSGLGYQDYGRASVDGGVTFGPLEILSANVKNDWEPENVAFGSDAFLTFHDLANNGIYVTSATSVKNNNTKWSNPQLISPTKLTSSYAHVFTSDGVNVFAMWGQQVKSRSPVWNAYVSYSGNNGSTWSSPIDISNNNVGVAAGNQDVTLFALTSNGSNCFASWTYTNSGTSQIYFAAS